MGVGFIGVAHVEALRRLGVNVVGVVGSTPERAEAKARVSNLPRVYESLERAHGRAGRRRRPRREPEPTRTPSRWLLSSGVNLEYDQALCQRVDERKGTAWLLAEMHSEGFGGRLMLGTDGARRRLWRTLGGGPGLAWLAGGFVDVLRRWGVDETARRRLFVDNPARVLALQP